MEFWLIFIIVCWIISSYLYRTSTFKPNYKERIAFLEKQLQEQLDELYERTKPKDKSKPKIIIPYKDNIPNICNLSLQSVSPFMFISAEDKQAYLNSSEWYAIRSQRLKIAQHKCEVCGSTHSLQCHHITYKRLTCEHIDDLAILCGGSNGCHQKIHDLLGYNRITKYPISVLK